MSPRPPAGEKRRHARRFLALSIAAREAFGAASRRFLVTDLSPGGMAVRTEAELESGMTLLFLSPGGRVIRGEVRSAQGPRGGARRYGVRFHKVADFSIN